MTSPGLVVPAPSLYGVKRNPEDACILVIEDDGKVASFIQTGLEQEDMPSMCCTTAIRRVNRRESSTTTRSSSI